MSDYESHVINLQGSNLVVVSAKKGYVMCGLLNIETAQRLGHAACSVSGVKNPDDVLEAKIQSCTTKARDMGVAEGMSGSEALKILS
jgi:uncharacterized protein YunC (DUF1805 family)